jgi:hypothetical protein
MLVKNCIQFDPLCDIRNIFFAFGPYHLNLANISRGHDFFGKQQIVSNST